jgi:YbgC/YbaW family acyl-CoA thioester hydrolase
MFVYKVKINFFDCDPAGILFYGRIYEVCHSAYEAMIETFSLKENYWNNDDYVVPIISSSAKYRVPVNYYDTLTVEISVSILKSSSFELEYICKNQDGDICVEVKTVHVCVGRTTWKKKELNVEIREGLKKHITAS